MGPLLLTLWMLSGTPRVHAHLVDAQATVSARDVAELSPDRLVRRAAMLVVLDHYIARGRYPTRTNDGYPGLRPRFIDDDNVHCAVGHLIAMSGAPELARAIDARFEYAYVRDIDSPALFAWADLHGFRLDELARIQPAYDGPPTADGFERELEYVKDRWLLACAPAGPPVAKVTLQLVGSDRGVVDATTPATDAFSRCVAARASELHRGGGAYRPSPEAFTARITVTLPAANDVLQRRLDNQHLAHECTPAPGPLVNSATLSIATTAGELAIEVTTSPANATVSACMTKRLAASTKDFAPIAGLAYTRKLAIPKHVSSGRVHDAIVIRAPDHATACWSAEAAPEQLAITATAKRDDKDFTLAFDRDNAFTQCLQPRLQRALRDHFIRNGVFRIDQNVSTRVTLDVESPAQRDARIKRSLEQAKRRRDRIRHEFE